MDVSFHNIRSRAYNIADRGKELVGDGFSAVKKQGSNVVKVFNDNPKTVIAIGLGALAIGSLGAVIGYRLDEKA